MSTIARDILNRINNVDTPPRPPIPLDNLCQDCNRNEQRYIKKNRYLCKYCWDRDEDLRWACLTDAELDTLREANRVSASKTTRSIVNIGNVMS